MNKDKNNNRKLKETLLDMLLEIAIGLISFGIGIGVLSFFGQGLDEADFDIAMLIGSGIVLAIVIAICVVIHKIKSKKRSKNDTISEDANTPEDQQSE